MIELYTWRAPNGLPVSIMLEELGLPYVVHPVDLTRKAQAAPDFQALSPNGKIPLIIDQDGPGGPLRVFESGAILTYLAEKTERFLPTTGAARYEALEWLHWHITGLVPMLGQLLFFAVVSQEEVPAAMARYTSEVDRMLTILERRLTASPYVGGTDYSIVDMTVFSWLSFAPVFAGSILAGAIADRHAIRDWLVQVGERPAVKVGMLIPA